VKVAVIGIGGTGSAAARFLAEAGHQVTGFEQFRLGHDRGSSHGESRIIRYTYPDLLYTQMMGDAYPLWAALERAAGEELFVRCGGLLFGPDGHPRLVQTETTLRESRLPYERLSPEEARERFPGLRLQAGELALYQRESGFLRSTRCVLANARLARTAGAVLREETAVREIEPRRDGVLILTADGEEQLFDRVIVTAGAWIGRFFSRIRLPLRVSRQEVAYLAIREAPEQFAPGRFPVWIDAGERYYGFPSDGVVEGVKLAANHPGETVDPERVRRSVDGEYVEKVVEYAARRFPDLEARVTFATTCLYTNTPDEHFILDRVPESPHVWLVSGCSGHGFKFTVLLGKIAADLATGGSYPRDLGRFALRRFAHA